MHSACPLVVIGFAILYALALGPFIVGMFGLSVVYNRLAGFFLMPLGLPWKQNARCLP